MAASESASGETESSLGWMMALLGAEGYKEDG
jgi:hypothetical protein